MASSTLVRAILDLKKNWFAALHKKTIDNRLCLRYDDLYDPMESLDIKEALDRLPREIVDARNQRILRAMDLSIKHEYLPEALQSESEDLKAVQMIKITSLIEKANNSTQHNLLAMPVGLKQKRNVNTIVQKAGKGGELTHDETTIISGALDLTKKTAEVDMAPIESTFSLDVNSKLDWFEGLNRETVDEIWDDL